MKFRAISFVACLLLVMAAAPAFAGDVSFSFSVGGNYGGHHRGYHGSRWCGPSSYVSYRSCPTVYYSNRVYRTEPCVTSSTIYYNTTYVPTYVPRYTVETYSPSPYASRVIYAEPSRVYQTTEPEVVYTPPPAQLREPIVVERRVVEAPAVGADGWALMGLGDDRGAATQFAREVAAEPTAELPKVGFALASASQGSLDQSVWAMRRALAKDAGVLDRIMIGDDLRERLAGLIDRFIFVSPDKSLSKADALFMTASVHAILNEKDQARDAIRQAIAAGDDSAAAKNLSALVGQ